ncbi:hypothetical protein [Streptomyces sp. NPDC057910]|uniref:hypothetical protein n=1 Tax=Streptomyces sp. NPDC057910 TaxID=3346278 RepID=UPI0036EA1EA7
MVKHIEEHPLRHLLDSGVPCSLGSDDPLLLKTSLLTEDKTARTQLSMTDRQLATLAGTSIRSSGAPADLIARALTGIEDWLQRDITDRAEEFTEPPATSEWGAGIEQYANMPHRRQPASTNGTGSDRHLER